jgi:hypothetical protein
MCIRTACLEEDRFLKDRISGVAPHQLVDAMRRCPCVGRIRPITDTMLGGHLPSERRH